MLPEGEMSKSRAQAHSVHFWENAIHGYETELLSHVCLNGSFAHLSREEWNKRCFPTIDEDVTIRRITGFWCFIPDSVIIEPLRSHFYYKIFNFTQS